MSRAGGDNLSLMTHGAKVNVVAAILERGGRFLLGKRSLHKQSAPGYWCPISGRVEPGESQADAVVREVLEEVGIAVRAVAKVAECDTRDGSAVIHWWHEQPLDATLARLANDEHTELSWVSTEEMKRLAPIFDEDVAIFERFALDGRLPGDRPPCPAVKS